MKDIEIYKGKSLSELLEQVVKNCEEEKGRAIEMFDQIKDECNTKEQMMLIGPVAASYLEIASKQTDNLIKLANAIQKLHASDLEGDSGRSLSDIERSELLRHLEDNPIDPLTIRQRKKKKPQANDAPEQQEVFAFGEPLKDEDAKNKNSRRPRRLD